MRQISRQTIQEKPADLQTWHQFTCSRFLEVVGGLDVLR
jgi:hypothetical protein